MREREGRFRAKVLKNTTAKSIQGELNAAIAEDVILCRMFIEIISAINTNTWW